MPFKWRRLENKMVAVFAYVCVSFVRLVHLISALCENNDEEYAGSSAACFRRPLGLFCSPKFKSVGVQGTRYEGYQVKSMGFLVPGEHSEAWNNVEKILRVNIGKLGTMSNRIY